MIIICIRGMYTPGDGMQDWVEITGTTILCWIHNGSY